MGRGGDAELIGSPATPPPDVRKVCDLPEDPLVGLSALRPVFGAQPQLDRSDRFGGAEPPPHIRRLSRENQALLEIDEWLLCIMRRFHCVTKFNSSAFLAIGACNGSNWALSASARFR